MSETAEARKGGDRMELWVLQDGGAWMLPGPSHTRPVLSLFAACVTQQIKALSSIAYAKGN